MNIGSFRLFDARSQQAIEWRFSDNLNNVERSPKGSRSIFGEIWSAKALAERIAIVRRFNACRV